MDGFLFLWEKNTRKITNTMVYCYFSYNGMGRGPRVFENERGEGMAAGRPSKYDEKYCEQAYKLCLLGATDAELADFFNVNEDTINVWKKTYKEFSESLKRGKAEADATVAEKLYKRATGYSCKATKFATYEGEITDREEYIEHYPPDTTAAIFWLKNRQKDKWRDKQDVEHSGEIKMPNITIGK